MSGPGPMRTAVSVEDSAAEAAMRPSGMDDAAPPDDDMQWRDPNRARSQAGLDPAVRDAALLSQCNERVDQAWARSQPVKSISSAIEAHSCTALKGSGRQCTKCRICPREEEWSEVQGYYRPSKGKIFICADKEPSLEQVEATLSHELIHAFDHCRHGYAAALHTLRTACNPHSSLSCPRTVPARLPVAPVH